MLLTKTTFYTILAALCLTVVFMLSTSATAVALNQVSTGEYYATANPRGVDSTTATELGEDELRENPIYARLNQIINFLTIGVGIAITMSVVFAGLQYITSRGDPSKTKAAVERLWNAGIAIFLFVFMNIIIRWLIPGGTL